jgi:uncharacterized membrane protein YphA (DoxX/SURF4 family)
MKNASKTKQFPAMHILSISIGVIYFWFGLLKFFHSYSPAENIAIHTINVLSFHSLPKQFSLLMLAIVECAIGLLLILRLWMKPVLLLMFIHMFFTFTPFIFFPAKTFGHEPYAFTLLGQYIMKEYHYCKCWVGALAIFCKREC